MTKLITKTPFQLCNELIESLTQAEGAASQLVHHVGQPIKFMGIRDILALTKKGCIHIAPQNALLNPKTVYLKKRKS